MAKMTWAGFGKTDVGIMAYHLADDGTDDSKVRLNVGGSYVDLNERLRRELAEYLLSGLDDVSSVS